MEDLIAKILEETGRQWSVDGILITPTPEQVLEVLDRAVEQLFNLDTLTVFTTGGLKIEKNDRGRYDVYVHVGEYI